jgi:hypothetical protein
VGYENISTCRIVVENSEIIPLAATLPLIQMITNAAIWSEEKVTVGKTSVGKIVASFR